VQDRAGGRPVGRLFDWVAGTSTGSILAVAIAKGRSLDYCLQLYFRLKDTVFCGSKPYSDEAVEKILKEEFGENSVMADLTGVNLMLTTVLADRRPADLHSFRNYASGRCLWEATVTPSRPPFPAPPPPAQQKVWEAVRSSIAAPGYFRPHGRFVDGGLIANNPSLDLLTELTERNAVIRALTDRQGSVGWAVTDSKGPVRPGDLPSMVPPRVLLSLGCSKPPLEAVSSMECLWPGGLVGTVKMAFGLSNITKLLIDQATMADNQTVDRCRAFTSSLGVHYLRLSPLVSRDVSLDETRDEVLLQMLWETLVYCRKKTADIDRLVTLLVS